MNLGYMGIFCTIFVNFKLHKNEKYPLHPPGKKKRDKCATEISKFYTIYKIWQS